MAVIYEKPTDSTQWSKVVSLYSVTDFDTGTEATQTIFQYRFPEPRLVRNLYLANDASTLADATSGSLAFELLVVHPGSEAAYTGDGWIMPTDYHHVQQNSGGNTAGAWTLTSGALPLDTSSLDNSQHRYHIIRVATGSEPEVPILAFGVRARFVSGGEGAGVFNWSFGIGFDD